MAKKFDMEDGVKYASLGAAGVIVPKFVMGMQQVSDFIMNTPVLNMDLGGMATVGGIVLAGASIGIVDWMFFRK